MIRHPPSIILLFLPLIAFAAGNTHPAQVAVDISTDCGSLDTSVTINGRKWMPDVPAKSSFLLQIGGSSATSTVIHNNNLNPPPYGTARISRSQFSYSFPVSPGQKFLRLHFNPVFYKGFEGFMDLFTVEVGHFTLLGNFSASLTAQALGLKFIVKEFCLYLQEDEQQLNIIFSPSTSSPLLKTYAFINGIEIISAPSSLSFFHGGYTGVQVVGQNSKVYVDYNTALELVQRLNVRQSNNPSNGDFDQMFAVWAHKDQISTWKVPVDVGFRYLLRIHFTEKGLKAMGSNLLVFEVLIDEMIAHTNVDIGKGRDGNSNPRHMDYITSVTASRKQIKCDLVITLHSYDAPIGIDGNGLLAGFEVFKLSNLDCSLATPNPLPLPPVKSPRTIKQLLFSVIGYICGVNGLILILSLISVICHKSSKFREGINNKEENKPPNKVQRICLLFSLSEIQSATQNFSDGLLIGRGGFGQVYKGTIDNGDTTVAVKRLKLYSSQGASEFLTEIETLSTLRHYNLVTLIGYCHERAEMIVVYDYMPGGTLFDHLYKLPRENNGSSSLTWKQRLNICIGAARGLDYLHTGNGVTHRDVKPSNILLDENFVAKVSDFGLAKHEDRSKLESHVITRVVGTRGYYDPHYLSTGKLTRKSDVYSFGVVLLEVLCGRPPIDYNCPEDEHILTKWALENIKQGNIDQIVSSSLRDDVSEKSLKAFVTLAERCLHDEPKRRPTMVEVVFQLESVLEQLDDKQVLGLNETANVFDNNKDEPSIEIRLPATHSTDLKNHNHPLREEKNAGVDNAEVSVRRKDRRKGTMRKPHGFSLGIPFGTGLKHPGKINYYFQKFVKQIYV